LEIAADFFGNEILNIGFKSSLIGGFYGPESTWLSP